MPTNYASALSTLVRLGPAQRISDDVSHRIGRQSSFVQDYDVPNWSEATVTGKFRKDFAGITVDIQRPIDCEGWKRTLMMSKRLGQWRRW
jgi:hypothetical protein